MENKTKYTSRDSGICSSIPWYKLRMKEGTKRAERFLYFVNGLKYRK